MREILKRHTAENPRGSRGEVGGNKVEINENLPLNDQEKGEPWGFLAVY